MPLSVSHARRGWNARIVTGPSKPAQRDHAALMRVPLRVRRGVYAIRSHAGAIAIDVASSTIVSLAGAVTSATTCAPSAVRKRPTGQGSGRGRAHAGARTTRASRTTPIRNGPDVSSPPGQGKGPGRPPDVDRSPARIH
jgi:hypothetical protein